jgi:lipopolysaccharide export LptBFGC system permease protein LptF
MNQVEIGARRLLRRHAIAFAVSFGTLTALLLAQFMTKRLPALRANGAPPSTILVFMVLSVPFTAALTIPVSNLIAVLWVFTRPGASEVITAAREERRGARRLVAPVISASAVIAVLSLVWNTQILPRANERLALLQSELSHQSTHEPSSREMSISELRAAARGASAVAGPAALARVASYEIEIHKKYSLAAACVVLALAGLAFVLPFPHGGTLLAFGSACLIFVVYYIALVGGESLAHHLLVSPFLAMWMGNGLLLAFALPILWWGGRTRRHSP